MNIKDIDASRVLKFKALSETIRIRMIPHLSEPRTVKQVADILGIDHHSLYHHMRVLENANIVELVKTRELGNITEKYYKLVDNWIIMPAVGGGIDRARCRTGGTALHVPLETSGRTRLRATPDVPPAPSRTARVRWPGRHTAAATVRS